MSLYDPLHLKKEIFSTRFKNSLKNKYNDFIEEFFYHWMYFIYTGEYETTLVYPEILKNLQTEIYSNIFKDLTVNEKNEIQSYFEQMIVDEIHHTDLFELLLSRTFNISVTKNELELTKTNVINFLNTEDLIKVVIKYYVGECYLWTGFYLIYKNTTDIETKNFFHRVLIDESRHNNNIYKFFKKIKNNIKFDYSYYIEYTRHLRQFGLPFTMHKFGLTDDANKKNQQLIELVYNDTWHRSFNTIFLKKCYQLYQLADSSITFEEFFNLINKNELNWISSKNEVDSKDK